MYGLYAQRDISDAQAIKDLNLADFKVKELILDFVDVFKMPMDEDAHNRIIHKIDKTCEKFTERSRDRKSCFTGMAPIPYTIYAGTKLAGSELRRYFEYRRADSKYYELSNQKRKKYDAGAACRKAGFFKQGGFQMGNRQMHDGLQCCRGTVRRA